MKLVPDKCDNPYCPCKSGYEARILKDMFESIKKDDAVKKKGVK